MDAASPAGRPPKQEKNSSPGQHQELHQATAQLNAAPRATKFAHSVLCQRPRLSSAGLFFVLVRGRRRLALLHFLLLLLVALLQLLGLLLVALFQLLISGVIGALLRRSLVFLVLPLLQLLALLLLLLVHLGLLL